MTDISRRAVVTALLTMPISARLGWAAAVGQCTADAGALLTRTADALLALSPELASYNAVPAATNGGPLQRRLDDHSPDGEARLRAALRAAQRDLRQIDCPDPSREARHVTIARAVIDNALLAADLPYGHVQPFWFSGHVPYVVSQVAGPQIDSPNQMMAQQSVRSAAEADAYVEKLRDFRRAFDGVCDKLRADAAAGCVPPAVLMTKALAAIDAFRAVGPDNHPLVVALTQKMTDAGADTETRARFARHSATAVREQVLPAYARLREEVAALAAKGKTADGIWSLPDGEALYAANVRNLGDTKLTPNEIHELGVAEVARISGAMDRKLRALGYRDGTVGARMIGLGSEARFHYPDSEAGRARLLADLRAMIARVQALQPKFLNKATIPSQPVEVRRTPPFSEEGAPGGFYDGPSLDGSRPGIFWVNLRDMNAVTRFKLPTLTYHETVPGHHVQGAVALNQGEVPLLVKLASFNAYSEGWALYAEQLASELGLYAGDPFGDLGRLQDELFRAVRLVVDTGLHHHRWTREQAIAYMRRITGNAESEVVAEIERYMAWPGQALGYKLGQLKLLELRRKARTALGRRFDIRDYHDVVLLNGPAPLALIEQAVDQWLSRR